MTVNFAGRVQGVGFRATTLDIAGGFEITGNVRNLADGTVSLVAEGKSEELHAFLQAIRARFSRNIVGEQSNWEPIDEASFSSFRIADTGLR